MSATRSETPSSIETGAVAAARSSQADTLLQRLYAWGLSFGESRAHVRANLGAPSSVATAASDNPYTPTTDTVTLMTYPHLEFLLVRAGADGREFLANLSLTGNRS